VSEFSLQILSEKFFLRNNERDIIKSVYWPLHVKYPLFLSDFNATLVFSTYLREIFTHQISLNTFQWELSCSMRTDGQTWRR